MSKEYKKFKNHLHNTLGITKEDIREMVQKSVDKVVERKMDVMFADQWHVQRLVDGAINQRITRDNFFWGTDKVNLDKYIKDAVVHKLIDGVKLEVSIKQPKRRKTSE